MVRKANTKVSLKRKSKKTKSKEESIVFACSSCAQPQLLIQGKRNILCHPKLQVGVCRECLIFAHSDLIPVDDEGYEIFCSWCSELGNLVCCDGCKAPFCEECISRNIGVEYYESLSECDEWNCFVCNPDPIEDLRELTKAALDHQNYKDPSDLLLEKCSAVFQGDADINDSDREEIVKERLRLRRNNLNDTMKKKKKKDEAAAAASDENDSDEDKKDESEDEKDASEASLSEDEETNSKKKKKSQSKKDNNDESDSKSDTDEETKSKKNKASKSKKDNDDKPASKSDTDEETNSEKKKKSESKKDNDDESDSNSDTDGETNSEKKKKSDKETNSRKSRFKKQHKFFKTKTEGKPDEEKLEKKEETEPKKESDNEELVISDDSEPAEDLLASEESDSKEPAVTLKEPLSILGISLDKSNSNAEESDDEASPPNSKKRSKMSSSDELDSEIKSKNKQPKRSAKSRKGTKK